MELLVAALIKVSDPQMSIDIANRRIQSNRDCPSKKLIANFFSLLERIGLVSIDGSQLTLFSLRNEIISFDYEASISWELKILIRLLNLADEWTAWRRDKLPT